MVTSWVTLVLFSMNWSTMQDFPTPKVTQMDTCVTDDDELEKVVIRIHCISNIISLQSFLILCRHLACFIISPHYRCICSCGEVSSRHAPLCHGAHFGLQVWLRISWLDPACLCRLLCHSDQFLWSLEHLALIFLFCHLNKMKSTFFVDSPLVSVIAISPGTIVSVLISFSSSASSSSAPVVVFPSRSVVPVSVTLSPIFSIRSVLSLLSVSPILSISPVVSVSPVVSLSSFNSVSSIAAISAFTSSVVSFSFVPSGCSSVTAFSWPSLSSAYDTESTIFYSLSSSLISALAKPALYPGWVLSSSVGFLVSLINILEYFLTAKPTS